MQKEYDLDRFLKAQEADYQQALAEIRSGCKRSHWIWYIFPQLKGMGRSWNSEYYGLAGIEEAKAYMAHEILRGRLLEITEALLQLESNSAICVMGGYTDAMKLRSCMTLFAKAAPEEAVFQRVLEQYYDGEMDASTLKRLG